MRCRRRYVVFEVVDGHLNLDQTVVLLRKELRANQNGVRTVFYDVDSGRGILFCRHHLLDELKKRIVERGIPMRVVGVSGTIRTAKRKFGSSQAGRGSARGRR
ncbi:MAG: hypothetical protein ACP5PX_01375 [Candidatus Hadarchaeum sp.]